MIRRDDLFALIVAHARQPVGEVIAIGGYVAVCVGEALAAAVDIVGFLCTAGAFAPAVLYLV